MHRSAFQNRFAIVTNISATRHAFGDKSVLRESVAGINTSTSAIFSTDRSMFVFTCIACVVTRYEKFFKMSKHAICETERKYAITFRFNNNNINSIICVYYIEWFLSMSTPFLIIKNLKGKNRTTFLKKIMFPLFFVHANF